jgi:hypothetical protein
MEQLAAFKLHPSVPAPPTTAVFGDYEIGRTSDPDYPLHQSAVFKDATPKSTKLELTGDPGAYEPWSFEEYLRRLHGNRKNSKPFDSTAFRDMSLK